MSLITGDVGALSWLITLSQAYLTPLPTVLGLAWAALLVFAPLSALVVGIVAIVRAERYPSEKAHLGVAIVGVVLAAAATLLMVFIVFALALIFITIMEAL